MPEQEQEMTTVTLVNGPFDGRQLYVERSEARGMVLTWHGELAFYKRDEAGAWRYDALHYMPAPSDDVVLDSVLRELGGESKLAELLGLVWIREIIRGNIPFFDAAAARVNRGSRS
jgi:hypothetical protein